ncbi:MAG TPA: type III polyketide synthase [Stellaceae bacterium]|nr:type III polyketide synthase [Stellaceae bacterium]
MSEKVFINRIGGAVPPYDVHRKFVDFAPRLLAGDRDRHLYRRMVERSQIARRYSCLPPSADPERLDAAGFYRRGAFPDTCERMARYEREAPPLALAAVESLGPDLARERVTHLIVASCTGFAAPGLDLQLAQALGLAPEVERTIVGFMGCSAAIPALKLARHIVRSRPQARVLVVAVELCTLHLQETGTLEAVLSFTLFADGAAAALVSGEPTGLEIEGFAAAVLPATADHITWRIGAFGFDMHLSGAVPAAISRNLPSLPILLPPDRRDTAYWAVHPGGRSVLDAVESALTLPPQALRHSRETLRQYGNMSSASVLFVLREILAETEAGRGCALAFGPGIAAEAMRFVKHRAASLL